MHAKHERERELVMKDGGWLARFTEISLCMKKKQKKTVIYKINENMYFSNGYKRAVCS